MAFGKPGSMGRGTGKQGGAPLGSAAAQFTPQAVVLEGDTYSTRGAALTGAVAGPVGSVSFWVNFTAGSGVIGDIIRTTNSRVEVRREVNNTISVAVSSAAGSFKFSTVSTMTDSDGWQHFCATWNTNFSAGNKTAQLLKNGTSDYQVIIDASAAFSPNYADANWAIGATTAGANRMTGLLKEVMFWPEAIDWSSSANLAKVYRNGSPVDPGASGSLVTGTAPLLYLSARQGEQASAFLTNRGTGGNFSQTGGAFVLEKRPIIAYGNSLVYGTGASSIPTTTFHFKACRGLSPPWRRLNYGVGGETSTQIKDRFVAAIAQHVADYPDAIYILEGGYNNNSSPSTVIADHTTMVNALLAVQPSAKYVGMGVPNGGAADQRFGGAAYSNFTSIESGLSSLYGERFVSPWRYFVNRSVSTTTSQFFIDSGLTPSAQDLTDLGDDFVPDSARNGTIHWDDDGHNGVGSFLVKQKIQSLGWG